MLLPLTASAPEPRCIALEALALEEIERPETICESYDSKVHPWGDGYVVKVSHSPELLYEALAMTQAKFHTQLAPIPMCYGVCTKTRDDGERVYCLLMERKLGIPVEEAWELWSDPQRDAFWQALTHFLGRLRQHRGPRISALDDVSGPKDRLFTRHSSRPADSEAQFLQDISDTVERRGAEHERIPFAQRTLGVLASLGGGHGHGGFPMTHGNFTENILVPDPQFEYGTVQDSVEILGVTGWRHAGFYPKWWEGAMLLMDDSAPLQKAAVRDGGDDHVLYAAVMKHIYEIVF